MQPNIDNNKLRESLSHVLWIGGGPDAGKTSIATLLVEKYGLQFYSCDEHAGDHWENFVSQDADSFGYKLMQIPVEERWLQPPETQMHNILRITQDDFPLVIADLRAMSGDRLILVEGNLPPELIAPLLTSPTQAIWLVASAEFYQASFYRREKHLGHRNDVDPDRTLANHMTRDKMFTEYVKNEALARGLTMLEIDGPLSLSEVMHTVEAHFKTFLTSGRSG
jgi:2-phosphoglycerate kinase